MAEVFPLKIISPTAVVVDTNVAMVEVPGTEGDFGVLPHHSALLSMIRPGVISVHLPDGQSRRFFAATGYADVSPQGCTILSDHIQDMEDITAADAAEALNAANSALAAAGTDREKRTAEQLLSAAQALSAALAA